MTEQVSLAAWLDHLERLHPQQIDLGLARISRVADRMGLRPFPARVITVAGTNGKGTVTHSISALARAAGIRVGTYTSPHLLRFNERIVIDGEAAPDQAVLGAFRDIDAARGDVTLTYFEFATLAALCIFREQAVGLAVLEVGLGGRLDATNMIDADVAVITRIGLDHQNWLGDTTEAIAIEKAGVARLDQPVVLAEMSYPASLLATLRSVGAIPLQAGVDWRWELIGDQLHVTLPGGHAVELKLPAALEPSNVAAALCAASLDCNVELMAVAPRVLASLSIPGRRQRIPVGGGELWLDVAHNPDAADGLARALSSTPAQRTYGLFAAMSDKDIAGILAPMAGHLLSLRVCELPDNPRAMPAEKIADAARCSGLADVSTYDAPESAWRSLQTALARGDRVVVFGSFFTVAGIMQLLNLPSGTEPVNPLG